MHIMLTAAAALVMVVIAFLLLRPGRDCFNISPVINSTYKDPQAWLRHVAVDTEGVIYTLELVNGQDFYSAHTPRGKLIWRVGDCSNANFLDAFVAFPGAERGSLAWYTGSEENGHLWLTISRHGRISSKRLQEESNRKVEFLSAVAASDGLYAVGSSEDANMVVSKFDSKGKERWIRFEKSQGSYDHAGMDTSGNLIAAGEPYAITGTRVAKYSAEGRRLWFKEIRAADAASTVWLGTGKDDAVFVVVRLNNVVELTEAQEKRYVELGSKQTTGTGTTFADESGRDQNYALVTYNSKGVQTGKKVLSHGAWLLIENAVMNSKGEIYLVGNRQKVNRYGFPTEPDGAELIKCSSNGDIIWSRKVKLPDRCFVRGITLDDRDRVYVFGYSGGYMLEKPPSPSRLFVYRIADCR